MHETNLALYPAELSSPKENIRFELMTSRFEDEVSLVPVIPPKLGVAEGIIKENVARLSAFDGS